MLTHDSGLQRHRPDVVFVAQLLEDVAPSLAFDFLSLEPDQISRQIDETVTTLGNSIAAFRGRSDATIVLHNFALPPRPLLGIHECFAKDTQTSAIRQLNAQLVKAAADIPGVYVLDFDRLCSELGYDQWQNERMWYLGRIALSAQALPRLADLQAAFLQATIGSPRKCLVLDLDNTLWGGVVGEDGVAGIMLGHDFPGNVYLDVQRQILQLHQRGVLLAINSKNNDRDVEEVFEKHPDMLLRPDHFAARRINWQPKPQNMLEIAEELNIGVDSLVFLDDNPSECELMRQSLPEVLTWAAHDARSKADPFASLGWLRNSHVFDRLKLTQEDRNRGEMYLQQQQRKQLETSATSVEEFLRGLQMRVSISEMDDFTLPRVVELIGKTNQFNLTTRRHSEAKLREFQTDPRCAVFTMRVVDRFGDNGIVGVAIAAIADQECCIDTFLLSCRVIGRSVETAMLARLSDWACSQGAEKLVGIFIPTAKNAPAADFYRQHGFQRREDDANQTHSDQQATDWQLSLAECTVKFPEFIELDPTEEEPV